MPLCFWAAQTAVAAFELCVGTGMSMFSPYLPPHKAATTIQHAYHSYGDEEWEWRQKLLWAKYELEGHMTRAMQDLRDSDNVIYLVCDDYWIHWLDNG